jgi:hypothetical protein
MSRITLIKDKQFEGFDVLTFLYFKALYETTVMKATSLLFVSRQEECGSGGKKHLPSQHKALGSSPVLLKKKKK